MKKIIFSFIIFTISLFSQEADTTDLFSILQEEEIKKPEAVTATFKTTRIINGHSIEQLSGGVLDVKISHRFGRLNEGAYNFYGIDNAAIRIGLDYGITNWLMFGIGRSSYEKMFDTFLKIRLLSQEDNGNFFSIGFLSSAMYKSLKFENPDIPNYESSRLFYANQLLIAKKFSEDLSIQITPSVVHYNLVKSKTDPNDIFAVGVGARYKITKWVSFNVEHYYQVPKYKLPSTEDVSSIGFDIETGGHVFQLFVSNSTGIPEKNFIAGTTGRWDKGDIYFGFNIARVFTITQEGRNL